MPVSATLDHRSPRLPHVPVEPLLPQHGDERRKQGHQETGVHQARDGDDLARWDSWDGWDDGGLTGDRGVIESEEDCAEEGGRLFVRVWLKLRVDVDDECRADSGEQARLRHKSEMSWESGGW